MIRTYTELKQIPTFIERYRYLKIGGKVGEETFGSDRCLNQVFYRSKEWMDIRNYVIVRDLGCDLGIEGYEIIGKIFIHHMNPLTVEDILNRTEILLDPEYLICCTKNTHDAIHYGNENLLWTDPVIRTPNDTCPWKH